jgi:hypothetical protein
MRFSFHFAHRLWQRTLKAPLAAPRPSHGRRANRLGLERLEERTVPSSLPLLEIVGTGGMGVSSVAATSKNQFANQPTATPVTKQFDTQYPPNSATTDQFQGSSEAFFGDSAGSVVNFGQVAGLESVASPPIPMSVSAGTLANVATQNYGTPVNVHILPGAGQHVGQPVALLVSGQISLTGIGYGSLAANFGLSVSDNGVTNNVMSGSVNPLDYPSTQYTASNSAIILAKIGDTFSLTILDTLGGSFGLLSVGNNNTTGTADSNFSCYLYAFVPSVWTGAGANDLWSNPKNWADDQVPHAGASLLFPTGAHQLTNDDDLGYPFGSVVVEDNYDITGSSLTVNGAMSVQGPSGDPSFTDSCSTVVNGATVIGPGCNVNLTGSGSDNLTDLTIQGGSLTISVPTTFTPLPGATGSISVTQGGTLNLNAQAGLFLFGVGIPAGMTVTCDGTSSINVGQNANVTVNGTLTCLPGCNFTNNGTITGNGTVNCDTSTFTGTGTLETQNLNVNPGGDEDVSNVITPPGGTDTIQPGGTQVVPPDGSDQINGDLENQGDMQDNGKVQDNGAVSDDDAITVGPGAHLDVAGTLTEGSGGQLNNQGSLTIESSGMLNAVGPVILDPGSTFSAAGTVSGNVTVSPPIVTRPASLLTVAATSYPITGTAQAGSAVAVYDDPNNTGLLTGAGVTLLGSQQAGADGTYSVDVPLTPDAANHFLVAATIAGVQSAPTTAPTIWNLPVSAIWVNSDQVTIADARQTLVNQCVAAGINTIYVSVYQPTPNSAGRYMYDDADLAALIGLAHVKGIQVWATYGAPDWPSLGTDPSSFPMQRLAEVEAYNAANPTAAFDGVMLDIEYGFDPANPASNDDQENTFLTELLPLYQAAQSLLEPAGIKVGAAISAYWDPNTLTDPADQAAVTITYNSVTAPAYQQIIGLRLDQVVVLGYRDAAGSIPATEGDGIIGLDEDAVNYAATTRSGTSIIAGLETQDIVPAQQSFAGDGNLDMQGTMQTVAGYFPGSLAGIAIDAYGELYLSGQPNWADAFQSTPAFTVNPVTIPYGTPLADSLLGGTAVANGSSIPGTLTFVSGDGAVLATGVYTEEALFTPNDATDYVAVTAPVTVTVNQAATKATAHGAAIAYSATAQSVSLSATVAPLSSPGTVNEGTVTFAVFNSAGTIQIGSSVTSGTVSGGSAAAVFVLPANTALGSYQIHAVYNPGTDFTGSNDDTQKLTVGPSTTVSKITVGSQSRAISYGTPTSVTYAVTVTTHTHGANPPPVAIGVTGLPSGVAYHLSRVSLPAAGGSVTLTLTTTASVAAGAIPFVVTATASTALGQNGTLTVAKAVQTIAFAALPGKTYGAPDFALTATASSGLPLSYTATGDATVAATGSVWSVHITGAGAATITAQQAGNNNYRAASVTRTVSISKAAQTITFATLPGVTYGAADFALNATASSGLPVTYTAAGSAGVSSVNGVWAVHVKGAGTAMITAHQAGDSDYNAAANLTRNLTIAKASPSFGDLNSPPIQSGTTTATVSGQVTAGTLAATGSVVITVTGNGLTLVNIATINSGGSFTARLRRNWAAGNYAVTYHYAGNTDFAAISPDASAMLDVS